MINFKKFWLIWFGTFIPILTICMTIYIFFIYPNQKYDIYDDFIYNAYNNANEIFIQMNALNFKYGCVMSFVISAILTAICVAVFNLYMINATEPKVVQAKVVSKEIRSQSINSVSGFTQIATYFVVNFELEDKTILQFRVNATQFSLMFEENEGLLVYREFLKTIYIDFI